MLIEHDIKLDYKDVLIRPKRSTLKSRSEVDLKRQFRFLYAQGPFGVSDRALFDGIPIMAANMDGVGTFEMAAALAKQHMFTCLVKTYSENELVSFFYNGNENYTRTNCVAMSIGISHEDEMKFRNVYERAGDYIKYVCIDVANGYTERFVEFIKHFRINYPRIVIIAGNVVTADQTQELILNGADIVKVGIGPGSVCTTRIQTGVGYPQLSAVIECADAAHGLGGHIIADGGCTTPGDVAKAFAAGADFVMLGGMLAGHDQGGGEVVSRWYKQDWFGADGKPVVEVKQFVHFYGMSSKTANDKYFNGLKDYRSSEGRTVLTKYKGDVNITIQDILGGVRSTCTYVGASTLKQLSKCTTFIRCNDTHNRVFESSTIGN
jgi:GMP reductase